MREGLSTPNHPECIHNGDAGGSKRRLPRVLDDPEHRRKKLKIDTEREYKY